MANTFETKERTTIARLATKQPHELLLIAGSALAVLLALVLFGIAWLQGIASNRLAGEVTIVIVNVILGGTLWVASAVVRKNAINGALVAGVASIILIAYGAQPGLIGGVAGLLGAILAAFSVYFPRSQRA